MFYILVALWIVACAAACGLRKVQRGYLATSCPCVAGTGLMAAAILYLANQQVAAYIVLAVSLYAAATILWSLKMQNNRMTHS